MNESKMAMEKPNADVTEIIPLGSDTAIKLSVEIVRSLIAVPTANGQLPSRNDCLKFIALCRAKHLNPFEGDAYMLGYDTRRGPSFSQITAHQVFLKRAEAHPQFDGMESGVVVEMNGEESAREGDRLRKGETLRGGWARVHRRDRSKPIYRELDIQVYSTGQSRWSKDPAGMIVKCAEADALRSAFPTHLGGLYSPEESHVRVSASELQPDPLVLTAPKDDDDSNPELQPAPGASVVTAPPAPKSLKTPQQDLAGLVTEAGYDFSFFQRWCVESGNVQNADSIASFEEISSADATRLLRSRKGLLELLKHMKEGAK